MELKTPKRTERLLAYHEAHHSALFCKQSTERAGRAIVVDTAPVRHVRRWEDALLVLLQEFIWQFRGKPDRIAEVSAKRWKGGWLLILAMRQADGTPRKWYAFGDDLTKMLQHAASKARLGDWRLKD